MNYVAKYRLLLIRLSAHPRDVLTDESYTPFTPSKHVYLHDKNGNQFQKSGLKQSFTYVFMIETNEQFLHVAESAIGLTCLRFG